MVNEGDVNILHRNVLNQNCLSKITDNDTKMYLIRLGVNYQMNKICKPYDDLIEYTRYINHYRKKS